MFRIDAFTPALVAMKFVDLFQQTLNFMENTKEKVVTNYLFIHLSVEPFIRFSSIGQSFIA